MKKNTFLFLLALLAVATACDRPNEPEQPDEPSFQLTKGGSYFWGNADDIWEMDDLNESNVLSLDMYSALLSYDSENQEYVGSGYNLYMENIFVNADQITLEAGTYVMDSVSGQPFTFTPGVWATQGYPYGTYLTTVRGTTITYEIITDGSFTVTLKGDSTLIDFRLQKEDGTIITPQFRGILTAYDASYDYSYEPQPASEQEWTFLRADTAQCYGDYYGNGTHNLDVLVENDEVFAYLELNCPPLTGDSIPAGTYQIDASHNAYTVTASQGYVADGNYDLPSYIGIYEEGSSYTDTYYLISGTLVVARAENGQYSLELNAVSYYGSVIHATYEGEIPLAITLLKSTVAAKSAPCAKMATADKRRRAAFGKRIQP